MSEENATTSKVELELDIFHSSDSLFLLLCSALVLCLHVGLILLRIDPARESTVHTSLAAKATFNFFLSALVFYYVGYMFAHGLPANGFIGYGNTVLSASIQDGSFKNKSFNVDQISACLFRILMATTTSVIMLSVIADRTNTVAASIPTIVLTGFIYPTIVHWCWSESGWLKSGVGTGVHYQDYAGAGVIHVTGATAGFVGNYFYPIVESEIIVDETISPNIGEIMSGVGYFAATIGFLGLNCGSQMHITDVRDGEAVAMIAINTILSAAICGVCIKIVIPLIERNETRSFRRTLNGGVCGMVAAAAGANNIYPWFAFIIGISSAVAFIILRALFRAFKIHDSDDAVAIHLGGGIAGTILAPLLSSRRHDEPTDTLEHSDIASYLGVLWNFFGVFIIFIWTALLSVLCFWISSKLRNYKYFLSKELLVSPSSFEGTEVHDKTHKNFLSNTGISSTVVSVTENISNKWKSRSISNATVVTNDIENLEHTSSNKTHQKQKVLSWIYHQIESDIRNDASVRLPTSNSSNVLSKQSSLVKVGKVRHPKSSDEMNKIKKSSSATRTYTKTANPRRESKNISPYKSPKNSSGKNHAFKNMFKMGEAKAVETANHDNSGHASVVVSKVTESNVEDDLQQDHSGSYSYTYDKSSSFTVPKKPHRKVLKRIDSSEKSLHKRGPTQRRKSLLEKTLQQRAGLVSSFNDIEEIEDSELELEGKFLF